MSSLKLSCISLALSAAVFGDIAHAAVYIHAEQLPETTFDFVIVGGTIILFAYVIFKLSSWSLIGGAAGSAIASRLTEIPEFSVAGISSVSFMAETDEISLIDISL